MSTNFSLFPVNSKVFISLLNTNYKVTFLSYLIGIRQTAMSLIKNVLLFVSNYIHNAIYTIFAK